MSKTDPKDEAQKEKFIEWLDEWWNGKVEEATEAKKKRGGSEKGILDDFLGV
jgi:hypothetical protein